MTTSRIALFAAMVALALPVGAQSSSTKVFTGLTLIQGTARPPLPDAVIVVRDGRIIDVGPRENVQLPAGAERVRLDGHYVIPGLINAHGHVNEPTDLSTYAAYGVTTVFSLGAGSDAVFAARDLQGTPALDRARVFIASPALAPMNPDSAIHLVNESAKKKIDVVKIRVDDNLGTTRKTPPDAYRAAIDAAHQRGLRVAAHLFYLSDARGLLDAGVDVLAHSIRDSVVNAAFGEAARTKGICYIPTLMREVSTFVYESTPPFFSDSLFLRHANREWLQSLSRPERQQEFKSSPSAQRYKAALEVAKQNLERLADAGVLVAMGTDTGPVGRFQGYFELMELGLMRDAGLTPAQIIAAATLDAARCMRVDQDLGTLERGKWADFVVLEANPLADINNVRRISAVYTAGNKVPR